MSPEAGSWRDVGPAADYPPDSARPVMRHGVRLAVGRAGSTLFAVDGLCPHAGAVLGEGLVDGSLLVCPQHAYAFDVRSGRCEDDPACSVRAYPVRVSEGRVQVRL